MTELIEPMLTGKPYPIRGLVVYGVNMTHTLPNPDRTRQAMSGLDFMIAVDTLPQEYTRYADVVLPEATSLERFDPLNVISGKVGFISMRQPVVAPMYESKPGWWIARELGIRMGLEAYFPWKTYEEVLAWELANAGTTLDQMRKSGIHLAKSGRPYLSDWEQAGLSPFNTPSQKIEFYCEELAEAGLDPMPVYTPPPELPAGLLRLLYGRYPTHTFSRMGNNRWAAELNPENEVWINADLAAKMGIADQERVVLENQDGVVSPPVLARVTYRIRPDAVYMVHGFGHRAPGLRLAHAKGASDAELMTQYAIDPISGGSGLRVNGVRIRKAGESR